MTQKILGWPEPTEYGGHRVKRSNGDLNDRKATFTCVDCGTSEEGGVDWFGVGLDGCPARPESLDYLELRRDEGDPEPTAAEARDHWLDFARRIGLKVDDLHYIDDSREICAGFFFNGHAYHLRYNQPGRYGNHHIHAVKIEE